MATRRTFLLSAVLLACSTPQSSPAAPPAAPVSVVVAKADAGPSSVASHAAPEPPKKNPCDDDGSADACVAHALSERKGGPTADRVRNVEALAILETRCAKDHPRACEGVAETLQDFQYYGVRDDAEGCIRAWDKACRLKNLHACYRLGFYYTEWLTRDLAVDANGRVRKYRRADDHRRGLELMREACTAGITESCEHLKDALGP